MAGNVPIPLERILIIRTDRLGDLILTLPLAAAIRRSYPGAHIAMLLRRYPGAIVEGHPDLNELIWYDGPEGEPVPFPAMLRTLREGRFQAALVVYPRFRLAWMMFLAGIPIRIGSGFRFYSLLFTHRVFEHRKDARRHELEYNMQLLRPLGIEPPARNAMPGFRISVAPETAGIVSGWLEKHGIPPGKSFVILHPGSGKSAREWPLVSFAELGKKIVAESGLPVVVTGSGGEKGLVSELAGLIGDGAVGCAGVFTLKELAGLLASAALWVGHSTGPLHLCVALGTPVVGIYPRLVPMSAARWGPYSGRNRVVQPDRPADCMECVDAAGGTCACMESISVGEVFGAVRDLLDRKENRG